MTAIAAISTRSSVVGYLALALLTVLMAAPGIAQMPVLDRDEGRYVMATQQMVQSGDYIDIRNQDQPRYKKPVGIYWLQSAAVLISGQGADAPIWVYRTVSVAGAVLAVLGTAWTASRLFGPMAGLAAGAVLAAIFGVVFEARIAKTDAMLLATAVFAQGALMQIYVGARAGQTVERWLPWIFWAAIGCAILIKGPVVPLLSTLTVLALFIVDRDMRWLGRLRIVPGLVLALAIALPWYVAITVKSGWAFWDEALLNDLLGKVTQGQQQHGGPPGYYFVTYALYTWPFGAAMLLAGLLAFGRARREPALMFLVCWYIPFWLVFEFTATKLPHYVIPAYPALAIATGWAVTRGAQLAADQFRLWQRVLFWLILAGQLFVTIGLAGLAIAGPIWLGQGWNPIGLIAALAVLVAGTLTIPYGRRFDMRRVGYGLVATAVAYASLFSAVVPSFDRMWMTPRMHAAFVAHRPCPGSVLAVANYHEPSLVVLAGPDTVLTGIDGLGDHLAAAPDCALVFVPGNQAEALAARMGEADASIQLLAEVSGLNYSNGRVLDMQLYRLAEPGQ